MANEVTEPASYRQWHSFWAGSVIGQQAVAQLVSIPWGHNLAIISKFHSHAEACATSCRALKRWPLIWGNAMNSKMVRLTAQLAEQFAESAKLEGDIRKNLAGLGYVW